MPNGRGPNYGALWRPDNRWLLCLGAPITERQHARMPQFILGVGIAEPLATYRAAYGRRVGAGGTAN